MGPCMRVLEGGGGIWGLILRLMVFFFFSFLLFLLSLFSSFSPFLGYFKLRTEGVLMIRNRSNLLPPPRKGRPSLVAVAAAGS